MTQQVFFTFTFHENGNKVGLGNTTPCLGTVGKHVHHFQFSKKGSLMDEPYQTNNMLL